MALKQDLENIGDRSNRILALLRLRQQLRVEIEENPDLGIDITPAIKQEWATRAQVLQDEIKSIVGGW